MATLAVAVAMVVVTMQQTEIGGPLGAPVPTEIVPTPEPTDEPTVEPTEEPEPEPVVLPSPRAYLYAQYPGLARRLDCMIQLESTWDPGARAGPYIGLAQFDLPTWLETPEGRLGLSRYDPYASIDAMAWGVTHLGWGRWPVSSRRC